MTPRDSGQIFFKLGDLSAELGVESHVLRFWEKEFPQIKPLKVGDKKRLYRPRDLALFREIKRLLYDERFTIAGARKRLESGQVLQGQLFPENPAAAEEPEEAAGTARAGTVLDELKRDLMELRRLLQKEIKGNF